MDLIAALSAGEEEAVQTLIVGVLILVAIVAVLFFGLRAMRVAWASTAAGIVAVVGALLLLLIVF